MDGKESERDFISCFFRGGEIETEIGTGTEKETETETEREKKDPDMSGERCNVHWQLYYSVLP